MIFRYCPRCGGQLQKERVSDQIIPVCERPACRFEWWPAMHPAVSVILQQADGRVLVIERANEPFRGKADWPGGFVRYGERPAAAAAREVAEELGMTIAVQRVLGLDIDEYPYQGYLQLNLTVGYLAAPQPGETLVPDAAEVAAWHWTEPRGLMPEDFAFASSRTFLRALQRP